MLVLSRARSLRQEDPFGFVLLKMSTNFKTLENKEHSPNEEKLSSNPNEKKMTTLRLLKAV